MHARRWLLQQSGHRGPMRPSACAPISKPCPSFCGTTLDRHFKALYKTAVQRPCIHVLARVAGFSCGTKWRYRVLCVDVLTRGVGLAVHPSVPRRAGADAPSSGVQGARPAVLAGVRVARVPSRRHRPRGAPRRHRRRSRRRRGRNCRQRRGGAKRKTRGTGRVKSAAGDTTTESCHRHDHGTCSPPRRGRAVSSIDVARARGRSSRRVRGRRATLRTLSSLIY